MKVLLGRSYFGAGDWYMATRILLMMQKHRPDIQIHLLKYPQTPPALLRLPEECGVKLTYVDPTHHFPHGVNPFPNHYTGEFCPAGFDKFIPHVVYDNPRPADGEHLLTNMLRVLNTKLGTSVPLDWSCVAEPVVKETVAGLPEKFILMPSAGAHNTTSGPKEYQHMAVLADMLSQTLPVVQIGSVRDTPLPRATVRFNDLPLSQLWVLFRAATYGVFLENGLAHWAANCSLPCSVLFCSHQHALPASVAYPLMDPVHAYPESSSIATVFNQIKSKIPL